MDIKWSRAVDTFKLHGYWWYESAQKLPIDRYKDLLLLFEFINKLLHTSQRQHLITTIQQRYTQYRGRAVDNPEYGPMIEMLYRRKISFDHLKEFLQSYLMNTADIHYNTEDELKAYINDRAIAIGLAIGAIVGVSPSGYTHIVALSEGCWILHMLIECRRDIQHNHIYIPQSTLDRFGVTVDDLQHHCRQHTISEPIKSMIVYFVTIQEQFFAYALEGLSHIDQSSKDAALRLISLYEHKAEQIKKYDYNIFHPALRQSGKGMVSGYIIYRFRRIIGN